MFPLLPLLFVDVTTILLIVEPDGTDVLLIVKEPRAEVATVSFVPKKEFNIPTECRDDPEVNALLLITINKILCQFFEFTQNLKRSLYSQ